MAAFSYAYLPACRSTAAAAAAPEARTKRAPATPLAPQPYPVPPDNVEKYRYQLNTIGLHNGGHKQQKSRIQPPHPSPPLLFPASHPPSRASEVEGPLFCRLIEGFLVLRELPRDVCLQRIVRVRLLQHLQSRFDFVMVRQRKRDKGRAW